MIAAQLRFRKACEQITNVIEHSRIGRRIGTWGSADRRLVNVNHFVNILESEDFVELSGFLLQPIRNASRALIQNFVYKAALSRA